MNKDQQLRNILIITGSWVGLIVLSIALLPIVDITTITKPSYLWVPGLTMFAVGLLAFKPLPSFWQNLLATQIIGLIGLAIFALDLLSLQKSGLRYLNYIWAFPVANPIFWLFNLGSQPLYGWVLALPPGVAVAAGWSCQRIIFRPQHS